MNFVYRVVQNSIYTFISIFFTFLPSEPRSKRNTLTAGDSTQFSRPCDVFGLVLSASLPRHVVGFFSSLHAPVHVLLSGQLKKNNRQSSFEKTKKKNGRRRRRNVYFFTGRIVFVTDACDCLHVPLHFFLYHTRTYDITQRYGSYICFFFQFLLIFKKQSYI